MRVSGVYTSHRRDEACLLQRRAKWASPLTVSYIIAQNITLILFFTYLFAKDDGPLDRPTCGLRFFTFVN